MDLWHLLADIVALLLACLVGGGLASRFGQSPLVGYLLAGMLVGGPGGAGIVGSQEDLEKIAELGVALLLFSLGLEFSFKRLAGLGRKPLIGGAIQVLLTIAVVAGIAAAFGIGARSSIAVGVMAALSSTAVVLRMLMERGEVDMPHGRNSVGVLLTQDIAVVPLAVLMTALGGDGGAGDMALNIAKLLAMAIGLAAVLWLLSKAAVLLLGTLTLQRNRELTVLFATAAGLGAAWASHWAGISPALGAFVAGMLLGSSDFATQIRADVATLQTLLLTLFFGSAGMVADPGWILTHAHWVAAAAVAITTGKLLIVTGIFRSLGQPLRVAAATGLSLAQVGEFAFVLGAIGRASGVVSDDLYALVASVTIVSFIISALAVPRAPRFGDWAARTFGAAQGEDRLEGSSHRADVLIVGFGPSGQLASVPLMRRGLRVTVIDLNRQGVSLAREYGFDGHVGDAASREVLEHASVGEISLVVVTLPHFRTALRIVEMVRSLNPAATVLVRSRYHIDRLALTAAGGTVTTDEDCVGGALSGQVAEWMERRGPEPSAKS